jgi:hypothetical protein
MSKIKKSKQSLSLYSDDNPKTTIKGFGYKNKLKKQIEV